MNFEIQTLGGKLIGSRSAMKTLDRLTTLLPNAKINFEVIPPVTEKVEFGSMPNFRDPVSDEDEDDDDIMHDPDIQEMVKNGEHTCHMFDAHCQACEDDEEEEEEEEDEDDITLAELKEQLEDNMTLAEIQKELVKVEAAKKRLETIRLKKEKKEEGGCPAVWAPSTDVTEEMSEWRQNWRWVDEATFAALSRDHLPNF